MFRKLTSKAVVVFVMTPMVNLMVGCGDLRVNEPARNDNQSTTTAYSLGKTTSESLILQLSEATIFLHEAQFDQEARKLQISYSLQQVGRDPVLRLLTISGEGDDDTEELCYANITDDSGNTAFYFSVYASAFDTNTIIMTEKAGNDSLIITKAVLENRVYETYNANGLTYSLDFTDEEIYEYLARADRRHECFAAGVGDDDDQYARFDGFLDFYPENIAVNNNIDGNALVELLANEVFLAWVSSQTGIQWDKESDRISVEGLCKIAGYGTAKCWLGGWANPLCHVAVGVSIACLVKDIYDALT